MKHKYIFVFPLVVFSVTEGFSQIPLNTTPSRGVGQAQLALSSLSPNLVEGRELYSPQAVAFDTDATPPIVYVADTGNNRVLAWKDSAKFANGAPADLVIGQKDRFSTLQQGPGTSFSVGLSSPTGVAVRGRALFVVDAGNNRVLRFPNPFTQTDIFPDLVIGQTNFTKRDANYSGQVDAKGVSLLAGSQVFRASIQFDASGALWLTDSGNRRVLRFRDFTQNAPAADLELGQLDFNSVAQPLASTIANQQVRDRMNQPVSVNFDAQGNLYIADRDLNRVLMFTPPFASGMQAARILGVIIPPTAVGAPPVPQATIDRTTFSAPSGVVALPSNAGIAVIDAGNSRLLLFDRPTLWPPEDNSSNFSPLAKGVVGHTDYNTRSANNGQPSPSGSVFSAPISGQMLGTDLYLVDSANHRVIVMPFDGTTFQAAARVLGQDRLESNAPNLVEGREFQFVAQGRGGAVADAALLVDTRSDPPHLYVADPFNNRILGFRDMRKVKPGDKADIVIGQPDLVTTMCNYPNNSPDSPTQSSLCHPVGLALDNDGNLYVADSNNGRVLRFPNPFARGGTLPQADLVLGQSNFTVKITDPTPRTMAGPYGIAFAGESGLVVSDQVHNRVLYFPRIGNNFTNGQSATKVFGQPDFFSTGIGSNNNRMNGPQLIATDSDARTYVVDGGNNRVLIFDTINNLPPGDANSASALTGLAGPTGVFVSQITGEIWVANTTAGTALRYPRYDQLVLSPKPTLTIPTPVPTLAVTQDANGDLLVADYANRITIYYPGVKAVNGATFYDTFLGGTPALAPGMVASLKPVGQTFGTDTASYADLANPNPLPRVLADIQVLVNDNPAPLYLVSPQQINFQVPKSAPTSGTIDVTVLRRSTGQILGTSPIPMNVASPAIFTTTFTKPTRMAAIINQDGTVNSPTNPAARGSIVAIFATGQGVVANAPEDGVPSSGLVPTAEKPRVYITPCWTDDCAEPDDGISYSGLAPGLVGVWQINVRIPQKVAPANQVPLYMIYKSIPSLDSTAGDPSDPNRGFATVLAVKDK